MKQMVDEEVFESVDIRSLSEKDFREIIPSHMFTIRKESSSGEFIKWKSRLVAGGHKEMIEPGMDNSSPTAAKEAMFAAIGLASYRRMKIQTIDVKGAYLKAVLHKRQFMKLNKKLSDMLCSINGEFDKCRDAKGCCIVKLNKALYGLKESSKLWYETLSEVLLGAGYSIDHQDSCIFHKTSDEGKLSVLCVHVDDILCLSDDWNELDQLNGVLKQKFKDITIERGNKISYLGMTIEIGLDGREIKISQLGYIKSIK